MQKGLWQDSTPLHDKSSGEMKDKGHTKMIKEIHDNAVTKIKLYKDSNNSNIIIKKAVLSSLFISIQNITWIFS